MAAPDGRSDKPGGPGSDADLARRFDRLSRELDADRRGRAAVERPEGGSGQGYGQAVKLASEFIAGILVGAGLGWGLDRLAGTSPWGLIVLVLLGFGAGVLNVVRAAAPVSGSGGSGEDSGTGGRG
jgi:ATP synthase protein I